MPLLLIIGAAVTFVMFAPVKVTLFNVMGALVVGVAARKTAQVVTGAPASFGDVLRSIGLAFVFLVGVAFVLLGTGGAFSGIGVVLLLAGFLFAYVGGFKVGMGIDVVPAGIIAGVVTGVSMVLFLMFRALV